VRTERLEMVSGVAEAGDLLLLHGEVHNRVKGQVDEPKRPLDGRGREVAHSDADPLGTGLDSQSGEHRRREVDAMDGHPALAERHRDPTRPDTQLECSAPQ
jgi:hypothetical protein